jgi:hypothetical protein
VVFGHYPYTDTRPTSAAGYTVSNATWSSAAGGTITFTTNTQANATPATPLLYIGAGQQIITAGISPSGFNLACTLSAVTTTSATCTGTGSNPGTFSTGGNLKLVINAAVSGETVLAKSGDLVVSRNGTAASWNVSVKGTVIGAVPITDGAFGAIVIRRDASGNVSLYNSSAIESSLPLTPTFTATGITGAWSSSALTLGGSPSLYGPMSALLIWNRNLSDAELVQEVGVVRRDMAARGVTVQ